MSWRRDDVGSGVEEESVLGAVDRGSDPLPLFVSLVARGLAFIAGVEKSTEQSTRAHSHPQLPADAGSQMRKVLSAKKAGGKSNSR